MPITRQVKNVVKNYSTVEVKVREATSNDPWGPSSSLMADIADQTYNVVAFSEIMSMIWKRLNDHGKNWRHVYKSLVLLDYILKTGSERVAQQCRENIFAIQTLKDFQFIDRDGKDQGMNVREKSKQLVALLKDEERLKNERTRALKAKERLAQTSGPVGSAKLKPGSSGSTSDVRVEKAAEPSPASRSWEPERRTYNSEIEKSRPSNSNEEELQLQLALALSQQEANETKEKIEKDEKRFQIALSESRQSMKRPTDNTLSSIAASGAPPVQYPDPWGAPAPIIQPPPESSRAPKTQPWVPTDSQVDPWGGPTASQPGPTQSVPPSTLVSQDIGFPRPSDQMPVPDPWGATADIPHQSDPWAPSHTADPFQNTQLAASGNSWDSDPFSTSTNTSNAGSGMFGATSVVDPWVDPNQATPNGSSNNMQAFDVSGFSKAHPSNEKKSDLLSDHSTLVNLDSLASVNKESNPFFTPTPQPTKSGNPFAQEKPAAPSLNQLRTNQPPLIPQQNPTPFGDPLLPAPLIPTGTAPSAVATSNPFL